MFQHNGNNLSALCNYFSDRSEFGDELAQSRRNSVFLHCSWPLAQPRRPSQTLSLPTLVDGWSPNGHDVVITIFSSDGLSCCVCNTCSSLAVLLEWACTSAYQLVVLFLSVTLYWSLPSVPPSQSSISKILSCGQQWDGNPWTSDLLSALKTCIFLSASFFWKYCVYFYLLLNVSKEQSAPVKLLLLYDIHSIFL